MVIRRYKKESNKELLKQLKKMYKASKELVECIEDRIEEEEDDDDDDDDDLNYREERGERVHHRMNRRSYSR